MKKSAAIILAATVALACSSPKDRIDLAGNWQVSLDSLETFQPIVLPGTTDLAGLGTPNTLEPGITHPQINRLTRKHSFLGAAWYERTFTVPPSMAGKPLAITLERVIWQSQVWIDGKRLPGAEESLTTPHRYMLQDGLKEGEHTIRIRIDNRKRYDISWNDLAHSYTNDTQVIWNGILGEISIRALEGIDVAQVDVYPDVATKTARIVARFTATADAPPTAEVRFKVDGRPARTREVSINGQETIVEQVVELGPDAALWDEFNPALHTVKVSCGKSSEAVKFGLREFKAAGSRFEVNGRRVFLRGTLDCCIFPLTGNPPLDEDGWKKEFEVCREWGINHIRFHSWCPPDAAFRVADRMGFYLQVELPDWARTIGQEDVDAFLKSEYDRIIRNYGNHPSFCMLTCGNELDRGYDFLNSLLAYMKNKDPRHVYTNSSYSMGAGHKGHPEPEDQYMVASRSYLGQVRGQDYIGSREPNFNSDYSATAVDFGIPFVSHEIGQYSVYPDMSEIEKYTGTLIPLNFMGIKNILKEKGLLDRAADWTMASGKLAAILYKEEVERALRTPGLAGFQMLGLQDFSGQSTALVGLVDAFWDSKGLVPPEWFAGACSPVTPLARFEKACWTNRETFSAPIEIANYGPEDLHSDIRWTLSDGSTSVASGIIKGAEIPTGGNTRLDEGVRASLTGINKATELTLTISVDKTRWTNSWSVWVYPDVEPELGDVILARTYAEATDALAKGGKVLLAADPRELNGAAGKFPPVFWSPVFFPKEAGTMGILCDPSHPALAMFPTAMHSDWQWWNLVVRSKAMVIDNIPEVGAIVEAVDNFVQNRRLAYIFETRYGEGRLLMCSMDLLGEKNSAKPEVRQLLGSLLSYMNSEAFDPASSIGEEEFKALFR